MNAVVSERQPRWRGARFIAGHRYVSRPAMAGEVGLVTLWIKLPPGHLDELAEALSHFPDVRRKRLAEPNGVRAYHLSGDGFVATLVKENRARRCATLLVETFGPRPSRLGGDAEFWDYVVGDSIHSVGAPLGQPRPAPAQPQARKDAPTDAAKLPQVDGVNAIELGPVRITPIGTGLLFEIRGRKGEVASTVIATREDAFYLSELIGDFSVRAIRYTESLTQRLTRPRRLWEYIAPANMQARSSQEGILVGEIKVTQGGPEVRFTIQRGEGTVRAVLEDEDAYRLHELLRQAALKMMKVAASGSSPTE